ncbi:MAG TPA: hypothetical protein VHV81_05170 [Steroidobacteraceae bacterium]|jgi:uncharacterized membrane protein|nr:hypothetical protein [Steroidobacteraceae bacterium]
MTIRIASVGQAVFAATLVAIGIIGLFRGDFAPVWEPVPKGLHAREFLIYLTALISLGTGLGLLWRPAAACAARALLLCLVIWMLAFRVPVILRAPLVAVVWEQWGETAVIVAAAWILYVWLASDWDRRRLGFAAGALGLRIARAIFGLALLAFGVAHFAYVPETASLVPGWLPAHVVWVYFTGAAYIAAGAAVLAGVRAQLAAALAAWQMGLFTLLVWLPAVAAGSRDPSQWSETVISVALTAGAWVIADSYAPRPAAPVAADLSPEN